MSGAQRVETDFDQHSAEYAEQGMEIEADLRSRCPVSWSTQHGGYWVVANREAITGALRDRELCSSAKTYDEQGNVFGGTSIPGNSAFHMVPLETDPPEWNAYRKLLNPTLAPPAVERLRPKIEAYTTEVINNVIETGHVDLVLDVFSPVTALITLDILDLPLEDWEFYAGPVHKFGYTQGRDPGVNADIQALLQRLRETITERKTHPGTGLIDDLIAARIDGEPIADETLLNMTYLLLVGGFDTTSALLGNTFWFLDEHRDEHARLISDDAFLRTATEEFLRWSSPILGFGRTARQEFEIEGQSILPGERLWMIYRAANHDAATFKDPEDVDLTRFPNPHFAFGTGIHRCLGSNLARAVFQTVLRQLLVRMPDFRIDRENAHRFPRRAKVNGWMDMPARFSPGNRLSAGLDLDGRLPSRHEHH